jgi:hypothetical protein
MLQNGFLAQCLLYFEVINNHPTTHMKRIKTLLAVAAATAFTLGSAFAAQITGDIDFAGQAFFDTNSLATATQVTNFRSSDGTNNSADVTQANGDFSAIATGTKASFPNAYTFNPSSPTSPLWTVGGFTFNLTSSTVEFQSSKALFITGTGFLTGNGFDETPGVWAFSSQQADGSNQDSFSFSANTAAQPGQVPDGGSTVALLGAALVGVAAIRRKLAVG